MRIYTVIIGSCSYFEKVLSEMGFEGSDFNEVVSRHDTARAVGKNFILAEKLLVRNNHNHSIVESAHARLGALIEDVTIDDAEVVIHNPTRSLMLYLERQKTMGFIKLSVQKESRSRICEIGDVKEKIARVKDAVIGQDVALDEIAKTLNYLASTNRKKPYVLMLYGKSSVGKTETAHAIADAFFEGHVLEHHMSMFESVSHSEYLFGGKPNVSSLSYDLNERESNLVFLDEMDECPAFLHSAFYSLFDSPVFNDRVYEVDISGLLIILTCNYLSEGEIRKQLGDPIYYRIDKCVMYGDFDPCSIKMITDKEIGCQLSDLVENVDRELLVREAYRRISTMHENGRTISSKVRLSIEDLLYGHCSSD